MDARQPVLSLIIVAADHGRFLPGLFASLRAQGVDAEDTEILFVDNANTDDSLQLARAWGEGLACARLRILGTERRRSRGEARGLGLAGARGDYLLCLDGDCLLTGGYVHECMRGLRATGKDIALTGCIHLEPGESGPSRQSDTIEGRQVFLMRRAAWEKRARRSPDFLEGVPEPCSFLRLNRPLYLVRSRQACWRTPVASVDPESLSTAAVQG